MTRFTLAFACFFKLLFGGKLPAAAANYLPEEALRKALPAGDGGSDSKKKATAEKPKTVEKPKTAEKPKAASKSKSQQHNEGALALLALLQREGRLMDFLQESLEDYDDSDIGAAVRDIHRGAAKVIADYMTIEPVMPGEEDDAVTVPKGFDPTEIKLVGDVDGDPPFKGELRHHGWRVTAVKLPALSDGVDRNVLAPAEVELS